MTDRLIDCALAVLSEWLHDESHGNKGNGEISFTRADVEAATTRLAQVEELQQENDKLRARAIVAEQHKVLSLLGKSSYQEVVEDGLRVQLAECQVEREALRATANANAYAAVVRDEELSSTRLAPQQETPRQAEDIERRLEELAFGFHTGIEKEYGCPGLTCPGVQRLIVALRGLIGVGVADWVKRANAEAVASSRRETQEPST